MDILEHNPMAFFVGKVKFLGSDNVLSLTKSNLVQLLDWVNVVCLRKSLDIFDRVGSWRKDEEDRCGVGGVSECALKHLDGAACGITVHKGVTIWQSYSHEVVECNVAPVWSQASHNQ